MLPGQRPDITVIRQLKSRKLAFRVVASGDGGDAFVEAHIVVVHECSSERRLAEIFTRRKGDQIFAATRDAYEGNDLSPEVRQHYDASYAVVQNDSTKTVAGRGLDTGGLGNTLRRLSHHYYLHRTRDCSISSSVFPLVSGRRQRI